MTSAPIVSPDATHVFDAALHLEPLGFEAQRSVWQAHTSEHYWNMVGPYGGITAAQLLAAIQRSPLCQGEPAAFTLNYLAPIAAGALEIEATCLRSTRSTQHWMVLARQGGEVVVSATALFGARRDVWSAPERRMPQVPPAEEVAPLPPGISPVAWVSQYDIRAVEGGWAALATGKEHEQSLTHQWIRDEPPRPLDAAAVVSMCDAFFPRIFLRRGRPIAAGTVSLSVYFHLGAAGLAENGTASLLGEAQGGTFRDGFFDQTAHLWRADGTPVATSHQLVWYKD